MGQGGGEEREKRRELRKVKSGDTDLQSSESR